jgi:quercetin dioxygenase-like cupin family protein
MQLERIPWPGGAPPEEPALRARLDADGFEAWRWTDAPGATYAPHSHDHDESLWVLEGEITFVIAGDLHRLRPGDRLQLPAGTVHEAEAGPRGATYLVGERRAA